MPVYPFSCAACGGESSTVRPMSANTTDKTCPNCGEDMSRQYSSPAFKRWQEHFSAATGSMVSSERQFKDDLKRKSEEATERTGIVHNFVPVDLRDEKPSGAGSEEQARAHRERGTPGWERKRSYH